MVKQHIASEKWKILKSTTVDGMAHLISWLMCEGEIANKENLLGLHKRWHQKGKQKT
jgi:hypothetical protein